MQVGKAYISSLGTTGLLIASSLLLLAVVSALVAFDSWPDQATAEPEVVAIASEPAPRAPAAPLAGPAALTAARSVATRETAREGAATSAAGFLGPARAGGVQVASDTDALELVAPAPVVTELPGGDAGSAPATHAGTASPTAPTAPTAPAPAPAPMEPELPVADGLLEIVTGDPSAEYDFNVPDATAPLGGAVRETLAVAGGLVETTR